MNKHCGAQVLNTLDPSNKVRRPPRPSLATPDEDIITRRNKKVIHTCSDTGIKVTRLGTSGE